jgi:hypothetical protein
MNCEKTVVRVSSPFHIVIFVLNIFFPGVGTIMSAFFDEEGINNSALVWGVLQLLTTFLIIGWCWSIYHGYLIYKKSSM